MRCRRNRKCHHVIRLFDHSFGRDYGLLMNEWHILARAVFVLDSDNIVRYVEYVDNINSEPDFEAAISAAKALNYE